MIEIVIGKIQQRGQQHQQVKLDELVEEKRVIVKVDKKKIYPYRLDKQQEIQDNLKEEKREVF